MSNQVKSPCIGVCQLDENEICVGCERHIQQIIDWPEISLPPINLNNSVSADQFYSDDSDEEEHW